MTRYLLRIDDVCDTMSKNNFDTVIKFCEKYKVMPLLGVVPCNRDPDLIIDEVESDFWKKIKSMHERKTCFLALHGYTHELVSNTDASPVMVSNHNEWSEFSGLSLEDQCLKIELGIKKFAEYDLFPDCFFAPAHSFDLTTIEALKLNGINKISDGIGLYPFKFHGIRFLPQQFGRPRKFPLGLISICLHLNHFSSQDLFELEKFLHKNSSKFVKSLDFEDESYFHAVMNFIFSKIYFVIRYFKKFTQLFFLKK